ncbi:VOC family protein [Corallococcus exercitus]|uniref:VOC family protein n=1 Tax=Corallococcus exercitus TaxID=2316736 RepID=A0A3A8HAG1_9BACT|nr:VOC family protein [Corallococcus exercitus]NOK39180.1 VOC family protein [Corallococcus exercitus]RKG68157.1 VOC family protein [Corallococcus exercitus]
MKGDASIPLLPCVELAPTLEFYALLGFEVTYQQRAPNPYAATRRGGAQLHFFGLKGLDPLKAFSSCLIIVDEVEELHARFLAALRTAHGRLPLRGLPRMTRMKKGQTRFTVVDPSGNSVMFIRRDEPSGYGDDAEAPTSILGKALKTARRLRDFKGDDAAAAKVLDVALKKVGAGTTMERARALVARAELAVALGDTPDALERVRDLSALPLSEAEHEALRLELEASGLNLPSPVT